MKKTEYFEYSKQGWEHPIGGKVNREFLDFKIELIEQLSIVQARISITERKISKILDLIYKLHKEDK